MLAIEEPLVISKVNLSVLSAAWALMAKYIITRDGSFGSMPFSGIISYLTVAVYSTVSIAYRIVT